ncbi:oligoendopeptidase F [Lachnospiraceae bacterium XBB1006]|nr:oligoendopeptidase F [Lachnospiraceae bacterium XBB1006]
MKKELLSRKEIPEQLTWDLSLLYDSEEAMLKDVDRLTEKVLHMVDTYQGKLTDATTICACLRELEEVNILITLTSHYADLGASVDFYDTHLQQLNNKVATILARESSKLSFVESEIVKQPDAVIKEAMKLEKSTSHYLADLLRLKPHMLNPETERVLSALSPTLQAPYTLYNTTKLADIQFDDFTVEGKTYPLGYTLFENNYEYEEDTAIRRAAFTAFSEKLRQYENTTAAIYQTQIQQEKIMADLTGFDSVFDRLLFFQKVDQSLYHRQVDVIMEKLAPHMRKYAKLIQKVHGLDKMTFADLKLPLDPGFTPSVTIEESEETIANALSVLGEDYVAMVHEAYRNRWIDFAQNKGKSTGGFCASPYSKNSYILLSWNEKMSDVFTLAHELGHAGHFKRCNHDQSIFDTEVSTYFVEAPSTMNELLLANYLKKTSDDKRFRRWVLANMINNTYYHNFVTHFIEAYYQREVYRLIDKGESVTAEILSGIMKDTLEKFWGDAVEITPGAELTWMRQPHYYMGLYSYTYSAGLTIATQVSKRIEKEGMPAVEDWKKVLSSGSTLDPIGLAALAKVDITTDGPLLDTIDYIGGIIDEICNLTEELEA